MNTTERNRPGLRKATGKDYDEWFALLDEWGAANREYREIADWLTGEHGFTKWWAQKVIVEYEESRGIRQPGVRGDGTFTITASKTVSVGVESLFDAFVAADLREQWLPGVVLDERTSKTPHSARFDWSHDGTRINCTFAAAGADKATVGVEHERLPDQQAAAHLKKYWRERLTVLKNLLESR